jgi:hypothetical protein
MNPLLVFILKLYIEYKREDDWKLTIETNLTQEMFINIYLFQT